MTVAITTPNQVFEFERVVTPKTQVKIGGKWVERGGVEFFVCLDCRHWHERVMATTVGRIVITCDCGCHDIHYTEIREES